VVYITRELLQVYIFQSDGVFVTILKKLAMAFVSEVRADSGIASEASHYRGKGNGSCPKKETGMIWDKCLCVKGSLN